MQPERRPAPVAAPGLTPQQPKGSKHLVSAMTLRGRRVGPPWATTVPAQGRRVPAVLWLPLLWL